MLNEDPWFESLRYMNDLLGDEPPLNTVQQLSRPDEVDRISRNELWAFRHLYTVRCYASVLSERHDEGPELLIVLMGQLISHLEKAAECLGLQLSLDKVEALSERLDQIPKSNIPDMFYDVKKLLAEMVKIGMPRLESGDMSVVSELKLLSDRLEIMASIVGNEELIKLAQSKKGSIFREKAAEAVYGPSDQLDPETQWEKMLVMMFESPEDFRGQMFGLDL
jgi:hypothetical protein